MKRITLCFALLAMMMTSLAYAKTPNGKPIRWVKTNEKVALLSFDDGPAVPYTEQILDILKKHEVKATFFVVGVNVKSHPQIIKRIMDEGHSLGNHSYTHEKLKYRSVGEVKRSLERTDKLIRDLGYEKEISFRAPFGQLSKNIETALKQLDKPHILFNFLPKDWENPPPKVIHDRVMERAKPGFIITLHDGWKRRENTVKATEMIITSLKEKGYRFVDADEFLAMDAQ